MLAWGVAKRVAVAAQELLSNAGSCFERRARRWSCSATARPSQACAIMQSEASCVSACGDVIDMCCHYCMSLSLSRQQRCCMRIKLR